MWSRIKNKGSDGINWAERKSHILFVKSWKKRTDVIVAKFQAVEDVDLQDQQSLPEFEAYEYVELHDQQSSWAAHDDVIPPQQS